MESAKSAAVGKGWVRDALVDRLAKGPANLTSLAKALGVSKPTVSHHLAGLLEHGVIEIVGTRSGIGGVLIKEYAIRGGVVVVPQSADAEKRELRMLDDVYNSSMMAWSGAPTGDDLYRLLYLLLLHLFDVTRTGHHALLGDYGRRGGELMAGRFARPGLRATAEGLARDFKEEGVASMAVVDIGSRHSTMLISSECMSSHDHGGRACFFVEGLLKGAFQATHGQKCRVERVEGVGLPACVFAIGRFGRAEMAGFRDSVFTSPVRLPPEEVA